MDSLANADVAGLLVSFSRCVASLGCNVLSRRILKFQDGFVRLCVCLAYCSSCEAVRVPCTCTFVEIVRCTFSVLVELYVAIVQMFPSTGGEVCKHGHYTVLNSF